MSVPRSGQKTKTKLKHKKKDGQSPKPDWKAQTRELESKVYKLQVSLRENKEELEESLEDLKALVAGQRAELKQHRRSGFGEREKTQLRVLSHFYRQMVNASICAADRKKVDSLIKTVQDALKEASK